MNIHCGKRENFAMREFRNDSGLTLSVYENGGTRLMACGNTMINQVEGHPLQGGFDRVFLRQHTAQGIESFSSAGAALRSRISENGVEWQSIHQGVESQVQLLIHPEEAVFYRICRAKNTTGSPVKIDWIAGQDLGLSEAGTLQSNEAYVCQYLDHKIVEHSSAGRVVFSRNNLGKAHPMLASFCAQGGLAASTDGFQFFGTGFKLSGQPEALKFQCLEDRVRQYEFAYAALQSEPVVLQPGESSETRFIYAFYPSHPGVSSERDLSDVDRLLAEPVPSFHGAVRSVPGGAFFAGIPLFQALSLSVDQLKQWFGNSWRHIERDESGELLSFFCGEDTHVVLPAKETVQERPHGNILKTRHGANLDSDLLTVACYGCGAFGSQFAVGNTSFGRFTTVMRNAAGLDRCSGIRLFVQNIYKEWKQLGFPSVFVMERTRCRWIYQSGAAIFEISVSVEGNEVVYRTSSLQGELPPLRMTLEVCADTVEFDTAPVVDWDVERGVLTIGTTPETVLGKLYPEARLIAGMTGFKEVGGAEKISGNGEPVIVIDTLPGRVFEMAVSGHLETVQRDVKNVALPEPLDGFSIRSTSEKALRIDDTLKWFEHNALIHYAAPRGLEQYSGGAWGVRDVCQGPVEMLLATGHDEAVREILYRVFSHQYEDTHIWPQWFMFDRFHKIQQEESHGDIPFWPIKALCDYVEQTGDFEIFNAMLPYTDRKTFALTARRGTLAEHVKRVVKKIRLGCIVDTALPSYGDGDWNDSLQPANGEMKANMVSGWTASLAHQVLSGLSKVWKNAGKNFQPLEIEELDAFLKKMEEDIRTYIFKDGVAAGFVLINGGAPRYMLHPRDRETGIHYRLLPANRGMISQLFTPEEAEDHLAMIQKHLLFPDGAHLMDTIPAYRGGEATHFQRAETAACFGREVGMQYVHAHLRYCEALAQTGWAQELLDGLLTVSPVAIRETVPNARPRQANLYFSSSDADFFHRYEASDKYAELKEGRIPVSGGWRLYSSGPGIFIGLVLTRLFGIRRSFGSIVIDPVISKELDGAEITLSLCGKPVRWVYHVKETYGPKKIVVNGESVDFCRLKNRYRTGGAAISQSMIKALPQTGGQIEIFV